MRKEWSFPSYMIIEMAFFCTKISKFCKLSTNTISKLFIIKRHLWSSHSPFKIGVICSISGFSGPLYESFKHRFPSSYDRCCIRKTCLCNEYPRKPHFYIVKLRYAGVYLFFLFLLQNIDCGYSLEPPRRGGSNLYPQSMF